MWRCLGCGEKIEEPFDACWRCGAARDPEAPEVDPQPPVPPAPRCAACGEDLESLGPVDLRTGGPDAGFRLWREWAEMDERLWHLLAYACPRCGEVRLFRPPEDASG